MQWQALLYAFLEQRVLWGPGDAFCISYDSSCLIFLYLSQKCIQWTGLWQTNNEHLGGERMKHREQLKSESCWNQWRYSTGPSKACVSHTTTLTVTPNSLLVPSVLKVLALQQRFLASWDKTFVCSPPELAQKALKRLQPPSDPAPGILAVTSSTAPHCYKILCSSLQPLEQEFWTTYNHLSSFAFQPLTSLNFCAGKSFCFFFLYLMAFLTCAACIPSFLNARCKVQEIQWPPTLYFSIYRTEQGLYFPGRWFPPGVFVLYLLA